MIVLLDTTVLIDVLRGRTNRRMLLERLFEEGHTLATSALNVGEVYSGMRVGEEVKTATFLSTLDCYPITLQIARRAGTLKSTWAQKGEMLSLADMLVAATVLEHGLTLMTDNRKDFPLDEVPFI